MNIKINEQQHNCLQSLTVERYEFGSKVYGLNTENSDTDIFCIFKMDSIEPFNFLPNNHQFQYTDEVNKIDYVYSTNLQFLKNLFSGDSIINTEICILYDLYMKPYLKTYKIVKALLGYAKRDIKFFKKDKTKRRIVFAFKSLFLAQCILQETNISKETIKNYLNNVDFTATNNVITVAETLYNLLFIQLQEEFNNNTIKMYIEAKSKSNNIDIDTSLLLLMLNSNNTKEFKYE